MLILYYPSKKAMIESLLGTKENPKESTIHDMRYTETSMSGDEVKENCTVAGSNRPSITRVMVTHVSKSGKMTRKLAGEFFASVIVKDGKIIKIS